MPKESGSKRSALILRLAVGEHHVDIIKISSAGNRRRSVLVKFTKVLAKRPLGIDVEVCLIPEEDYSASGDEASKIILLRVGQLGKIDATNLSANLGIVIKDVRGIR